MQLQKLMVKYAVVTRVTPYQVHTMVHKKCTSYVLLAGKIQVGGKNSGEGERGKGERACRVYIRICK
eukprot:scaffold14510_cov215-Skeletonema_marinoi.AAC.2